MTDFITVEYGSTGASKTTNELGMRAMQARAYDARNSQYLLIKSPPASGKSRALMFLGLDKLHNQGLKKVIVAVPERSIGNSFRSTNLADHGFFADWVVSPRNNLCDMLGGEGGKINAFVRFMDSDDDEIIVCTHSTLRHAFDRIMKEGRGIAAFHDCVLAVDEFHHVSADADNRLGELIRAVMAEDSIHIVAMTGSYFRGDQVPVLRAEDEEKFTRVTYTYYEQLSGYEHLKTLGIGYHFYHGNYLAAIGEVLDPSKKTIIHIPNVNSQAALGDKIREMNGILDVLGDVETVDPATGFQHLRTPDGRILKIADLVTPQTQQTVLSGLRTVENKEDLDIVIALGMAKEGFDWIWCEHALTVGYRGSLTEVVQIIGRATRDAPGKAHAQFTNLIAEPDTTDDVVRTAVNDMLKAIACSLLMEQVLAPNFNFKTKPSDDRFDGASRPGSKIDLADPEPTIEINGLKEPASKRAKEIIQTDMTDLMAAVLQDNQVLRASLIPGEFPPETVNQVLIPNLIAKRYPDIAENEDDIEAIRQNVVARRAVLATLTGTSSTASNNADGDEATEGQKAHAQLLKLTSKFLSLPELSIDLIDQVNPFHGSYEILSKALGESVLRRIHQTIAETRIEITEAEAMAQLPRIRAFVDEHNGREPSITSANPIERRMAEALAWIRAAAVRRQKEKAKDQAA
ncbi:ATP-dependent helicase [Sphingomonas sp. HDW15A]|uniref:DEAD/DEAH box helicase n=1 Tax=Sphingomonas sp. HDW15A TaxID=2714942 RepID=UPI00140E5F94|nr:DEAD/DEAH box helicase family protein [Sphingomonas sp. HDW15A]QIK95557.1 ATP-dependent helicase [Sphingomonas sp. HDW15A]